MRLALLSSVLIASAFFAAPARADVGPRAPCGAGTHHEYLYGHRCVKDGFHLERDADGHPTEVANGKTLERPPAPAPTPQPPVPTATATATAAPAPSFATPPEPSAAPPAPPPAPPPEPPSARGCGCDLAASSPGIALGSIALGVGLLGLSRRRRRSR